MIRRRAVILPAVLFVLILVALLGAMYSFRVHADVAMLNASNQRRQTELAAEAGIEVMKQILRADRYFMDAWYHNPEELHRVIVWGHGLDETEAGRNNEFARGEMIYRFSIVADDPNDDEEFIRIGATDEASKLNLNSASPTQLQRFLERMLADREDVDQRAILDAILDWRDTDDQLSGESADTEGQYYAQLDKPYRVKNGPFDSVEELLLVKGITGQILYGEDFDRNGIRTLNEEDGDLTFPPDNQDTDLNRGLYPYLTVHSYENNVDNSNRPRTYLFGDKDLLRAALEDSFESGVVVDYIMDVAALGPKGGAKSGGQGQQDGGNPQQGEENGEGEEQSDEQGDEFGEENDGEENGEGDEQPGGENGQEEPGGGQGNNNRPIRTPVSLMFEFQIGENVRPSPLTVEDLSILLDRFTTLPPDQRRQPGLINVNTAPLPVLTTIVGLSEEQAQAIIETRGQVRPELKETIAWLAIEGVLDLDTLDVIAPVITARAQQFTVESLGYGDHTGMVTRIQAVIDLVGPMAQTVYRRDITKVGVNFPIREEDLERIPGA